MSSLLTLVSPSGMLDLALKSLVVLLLAAVLALLLGRASAAWRHLVWCLGVAGLLLLPALSLTLPAWRVSWLPQWTAVQEPTAHEQQIAPSRAEPSKPLAGSSGTMIVPPEFRSAETAAGHAPMPAATVNQPAEPSPLQFPWLAMGWAVGGMLPLVPLAIGLGQLAALHRRSRVVEDPRWRLQLDGLRRQVGVRREVQLRQTDTVRVPLTWGGLRPVVLVPVESETWPETRRRLVLLHELAHVRRWDWLTQLVAHVACALYWFNPLVWLAARQMRIERERACDDLVLASGARASEYAHELLALAAGSSKSRLSSLVAVPMARRGALEDRVRGILDSRRNRAALTAAAVYLGAALAVATIAQLAVLRAAAPNADNPTPAVAPAAEEPVPAEPAREDLVPEEPAPDASTVRAHGISIRVKNAKGDRGIPEFRVVAGVNSGGVSGDFERQTGRTVVNWQPHTCRVGKDGGYVWPLDKAYAEMALRVEADGYQPQVATGIKKANGPQQLVFLLLEDKGIAGRALTPAGAPAADAIVALAIPHQEIVWEDGKLRGAEDPLPAKPGDRWRLPRFVKCDATGRFRLPTEIEPAAVLVVHESGVLEMSYDAWRKSPEVTLRPWGSIAGQVLWQDKPGADEDIGLTVHRDEYGYPGMVASYAKTRTGKDGRFAFHRVLPGLVQISRPIATAEPNATGITSVILDGMFRHVTITPGDPTLVLLGGQGRKVTGKFVGLESWEGATYHFHPTAPHIGFGGDDLAWKAFAQLKASPIGPMLFRDKQPINQDGTFTIERMLPGRYQLFLSAPGFKNYAASEAVQVDPETPGEDPAAVELKDIATRTQPAAADSPVKKPEQKPAEPPTEKPTERPTKKPTAKTTTIRGKVLDDATGEPISRLIIQGGKFDPADPKKVTWGYSEGRTSSVDGLFTTTIRWDDGWTARILADGYLPRPVITSAPPADKDVVEVVIRLKRGPTVRGIVLDHAGKPVRDAVIVAIGPTGVDLSGGHSSIGNTQGARSGADGRFELSIGDAKLLAVSHSTLQAWSAEIPADGDVTIRLPEPARVDVELAIEGADKESVVFYQLLTQGRKEFKGLRLEPELRASNPGKLSLSALPPGRYQICRNVMNNLGQIGIGAMLERQLFELKAGETKAINWVRDKGVRVRGKVVSPKDTTLMGTVVSVRGLLDEKSPFDTFEWPIVFASQKAAEDGSFHTERIRPGKYRLVAEAYIPLTEEQRIRSGYIRPSYRAQATIDVPADGELKVDDLVLVPSQADE